MARAPRSYYGRFTGGPDPLAPPVDLAEALDAVSESVMDGYSADSALREFLRRGGRAQDGLDQLAGRILHSRRDLLSRHRLDGTLQEADRSRRQAARAERGQPARETEMDSTDRTLREMTIENLPSSTAAVVTELSEYDWATHEARQAYEQIKELMGREMLDQRFAGMKQTLQGATEEDRAQVTEMLRDLGDLLEAHARGEATEDDFAEFMNRHGEDRKSTRLNSS